MAIILPGLYTYSELFEIGKAAVILGQLWTRMQACGIKTSNYFENQDN
jgi:hypothetical protein